MARCYCLIWFTHPLWVSKLQHAYVCCQPQVGYFGFTVTGNYPDSILQKDMAATSQLLHALVWLFFYICTKRTRNTLSLQNVRKVPFGFCFTHFFKERTRHRICVVKPFLRVVNLCFKPCNNQQLSKVVKILLNNIITM